MTKATTGGKKVTKEINPLKSIDARLTNLDSRITELSDASNERVDEINSRLDELQPGVGDTYADKDGMTYKFLPQKKPCKCNEGSPDLVTPFLIGVTAGIWIAVLILQACINRKDGRYYYVAD